MYRPRPPSLPDDLSDVARVVWTMDGVRLHRGRGWSFTTVGGAHWVNLWVRPGALAVVRRLHSEVPADRHERWPRAAPHALLLLRSDYPDRPLRPFETVRPGGVSPWVPVLGTVLGEIAGLAMRVLTGDAKFLLIGPAIGLTLGVARWWFARTGERRVVAEAPADRVAGFLLAAAAVAWLGAIAGLGLAGAVGAVPNWVLLLGTIGPVAFACAAVLTAIRLSRDFHAARRAEAVAEWDALRADPQREPPWRAALWNHAETRSDPDAAGRPGR